MRNLILCFCAAITIFSTYAFPEPQIGQSSIITLIFPWGARSTALGETFTGIADDEQALFYNPAGLGLSPLSKTWMHYSPSSEQKFTAIASGTRTQKDIWALNSQNQIYKFNGVDWVNYSIHTVDSSDNFSSIAEKYSSFENSEKLAEAVLEIKKFNNLYAKERKKISALLYKKLSLQTADSLARFLAFLPYSEQSKSGVKSYLLEYFSNEEVDEITEQIVTILDKITGLSGIYDLKIPYTIALNGKLNDIVCDGSGRLWVAGDSGLWRFDNEWKKFTAFDGVPQARFNSLTLLYGTTDIAIATSAGGYLFENGIFTKITGENELFDGEILFVNKINGNIYLGTTSGLLTISNGIENLTDSTKGLVSNIVRTIAVDSGKRIWVGGDEGVSLWTGIEWKKFRFKNSKVFDIAIEKDKKVWFATNNGAVEYYEGKDGLPEWKVYHEKNNLNSSVINSIIFHRNDIWLATDKGISCFQHGEVRATMFFENLLPSLHLNDMWHGTVAGVIPLGEWGTIGVFFNQLYFGNIESYNPNGTLESISSAFEMVSGVGYGMRIRKDFAAGINLKYFYSRLKENDAEAQSFAVDAGILKNNFLIRDLSLGFSMLNMGPLISYGNEDKSAIPFTFRFGTSYKPIKKATHYLLLALDLEREVVYIDNKSGNPSTFFKAIYKDLFNDERESRRDELKKITLHTGLEFCYLDFISPRLGWMYDKAGSRNEINIGLGLNINVISADFGMIFALGDNDVRQSQIRFSITYAR